MQCACAIFSSVSSLALLTFSTISQKLYDFRKKNVIKPKMCVLISSITFVWKFSHSKKNSAKYDKKKMCIGFHVKLFLLYFNEPLSSSTDYRKILKYRISRKSAQWDPSFFFQADGQTYTTNLTAAFRNLANAPKNAVRSTQ